VIGNDAYPDRPLHNAINDIRDVGIALRDLGFDVVEIANGTRHQILSGVTSFSQLLGGKRAQCIF
jgi:hypothetical protein